MEDRPPSDWLSRIYPQGTPEGEFPFLASLLGSWFHQDYWLAGDDLTAIIGEYKSTSSREEVAGAVDDIHRFLERYGADDRTLATSLVDIFSPGVIIEGWDGMSTREWLGRVIELLESPAE